MIDTPLLEQLVMLNTYQTLSETAKQMHISQPALSRSMQKLESELGVTLFERSKNRIVLNDAGKLAAEYASQILQLEDKMVTHLHAFARHQQSLVVGFCCTSIINKVVSAALSAFEGLSIMSEVKSEQSLMQGLDNGLYSFIILPYPVNASGYHCIELDDEQLMLSISKTHPLAQREALHLSDLKGMKILLYEGIGFWNTLLRKHLPDTHFISHNELDVLEELASASGWPRFRTTQTIKTIPASSARVRIPILDEVVHIQYYCVCKEKNHIILDKLSAQIAAMDTEFAPQAEEENSTTLTDPI